ELRLASPPPQRMRPSSQTTKRSRGDEKSAESTTLVKRKMPPTQIPVAGGGDDEIVDLTVGCEHETAADGTTSTAVAPQPGEFELPDIPLLDDDEPLKEFLIALNKVQVTDDEAADEAKDVALPLKKQWKLEKGGAATTSEISTSDKGKKATAFTTVVPVAES
ncbi:hypothetical protein Dimus_007978, partial [Dionaea muscipula]